MNRIRELRLERSKLLPEGNTAFTVKQVAARVGVSESTLRDWEAGNMRPSPRHARALARELGVTVEELGLGSEDPPEPS